MEGAIRNSREKSKHGQLIVSGNHPILSCSPQVDSALEWFPFTHDGLAFGHRPDIEAHDLLPNTRAQQTIRIALHCSTHFSTDPELAADPKRGHGHWNPANLFGISVLVVQITDGSVLPFLSPFIDGILSLLVLLCLPAPVVASLVVGSLAARLHFFKVLVPLGLGGPPLGKDRLLLFKLFVEVVSPRSACSEIVEHAHSELRGGGRSGVLYQRMRRKGLGAARCGGCHCNRHRCQNRLLGHCNSLACCHFLLIGGDSLLSEVNAKNNDAVSMVLDRN